MTLQRYIPTFFQAVGTEERWVGMREDSQDGAWYAAADVDQRIATLEAENARLLSDVNQDEGYERLKVRCAQQYDAIVRCKHEEQADICPWCEIERLRATLELFVSQWNACGPNSDFGRYFKNVRDAAVATLIENFQFGLDTHDKSDEGDL